MAAKTPNVKQGCIKTVGERVFVKDRTGKTHEFPKTPKGIKDALFYVEKLEDCTEFVRKHAPNDDYLCRAYKVKENPFMKGFDWNSPQARREAEEHRQAMIADPGFFPKEWNKL